MIQFDIAEINKRLLGNIHPTTDDKLNKDINKNMDDYNYLLSVLIEDLFDVIDESSNNPIFCEYGRKASSIIEELRDYIDDILKTL